jgi:PAS domain S-box-containing protein
MLPYLIIPTISLGLSSSVFLYAWRQRRVRGAPPFATFVACQASWTLGFILEMLSQSLEGKVFWDNFQFIGMMAAGPALLMFAIIFTEHPVRHPGIMWAALLVWPLISLVLVYTDPWHGLIRPGIELLTAGPIQSLYYPFSTTFGLMSLYSYGMVIIGIALLIRRYRRAGQYYRMQINIIVVGLLIPMGGGLLTLADLLPQALRDITPLTFGLENLIAAWGVFRYHLLDIVPIAREVVVDNIPSAVCVLDLQNRVIDANPALLEFLDRLESQVIGLPAAKVFDRWPETYARYASVQQAQEDFSVEIRSTVHDFHLSITPLLDRQKYTIGRLVILHDITDIRRAERALEEANKELEAFSYSVSHDLRAPLRSIDGFSRIVLEDHSQGLNPEGHHYLQQIRNSAQRMGQLIDDLLQLSRFGRLSLHVQSLSSTELHEIVHEIIGQLTTTAPERPVEWSVGKLVACSADRSLLRQVWENYLSNAFKYTRKRNPARIAVGSQASESQVTYFVRDNGIGFDMQYVGKLFGVFQRLHSDLEFEGTGVGLAIVQRIIHRQGGKVWAEGVNGEGATFYFSLPA